jgi:hypothetical protein
VAIPTSLSLSAGAAITRRASVCAAIATLLGCGGPAPLPEPTCEKIELDACSATAGSAFRFLVSSLDVPGPTDGVQVGLDLDCRTSDGDDHEGCRVTDATSPDGREGVDNAIGFLIAELDRAGAGIGIRAASETALADGSLVLPIEISGVASLEDAPCAIVRVNGVVAASALIEDGELRAYFPELPISLPTSAAPLSATLERVAIRGNVGETGITGGVIAGELSHTEASDAAIAVSPDAAYIDSIRSLVRSVADLGRDTTGACQRISIGIAFTAVPAA